MIVFLICAEINKGLKTLSLPKSFSSELSSRSKVGKDVSVRMDKLFCSFDEATENASECLASRLAKLLIQLMDKNKRSKVNI
jgi:hypothetical protein